MITRWGICLVRKLQRNGVPRPTNAKTVRGKPYQEHFPYREYVADFQRCRKAERWAHKRCKKKEIKQSIKPDIYVGDKAGYYPYNYDQLKPNRIIFQKGAHTDDFIRIVKTKCRHACGNLSYMQLFKCHF